MATIDATIGGINSNSYATVAEGDAYADENLYTAAWGNATADDQIRSLIMATRILNDECDWYGYKTVEEQALDWPRSHVWDKNDDKIDDNILPVWLKNATIELAINLLEKDRTAESDTKGFKMIKAGSLVLEIDKYDQAETLPDSVYNIIRYYCDLASKTVGVTRV